MPGEEEDGGSPTAPVPPASRAQRRREEEPWTPSAWARLREGRWHLAPPAATGALLVLAGVVTLLVLAATGGAGSVPTPTPGVAVPARGTPSSSATAPAVAPGTAAPTQAAVLTEVVVDVSGQVARPGLVRLPPGARVDDALRAAGGALGSADLRRVNRARPLTDGEQLVVPAPGEEVPAAAPTDPTATGRTGRGGAARTGATAPVDLNTATAADLDALPGVGPVLAQRILDWRSQHGRFSSVEELSEVTGIGPTTLARLAPLLTA